MSDQFDPYYKWLGIAPKDQPPNHYRLLGIDAFEANADVISNAADRQMAHLRSVSTGKHGSVAQGILNEISAARICLLDLEKKSAYDRQLRAALTVVDPVRPTTASPLIAASQPIVPAQPVAAARGSVRRPLNRRSSKSPKSQLMMAVAGGVGGIVLAVLILMLLSGGDDGASQPKSNESSHATAAVDLPPRTIASEEAESGSTDSATPLDSTDSAKSPQPPSRDPSDGVGDDGDRENGLEVTAAPLTNEPPTSAADKKAAKEKATEEKATEEKKEPRRDLGSLVGLAPPSDQTTTPGKLAVPSADIQAETLRRIKDVYNDSYKKAATTEGKAELAALLYNEATEIQDDPTVRFVILRQGYDVAMDAKDFPLALQFVDRLASDFEVDELRLRIHLLTQAARAARQNSERLEIADLALALVVVAVKSRRFDDALALVELADDLAARARDAQLRAELRSVAEELKGLREAWQAVQEPLIVLQQTPDEPAANLACGKYFCFTERDWQQGFPLLTKGSDQAFAEAAKQDQSGPSTSTNQERMGDIWWNLGETEEQASVQAGLRLRAAHWYRKSLPGLSGTAKSKVEKRIDEVALPTIDRLGPFRRLAGIWIVTYANGQGRRYVIDSQGSVIHGDQTAQLTKRDRRLFLDFGRNKLERVTLDGQVLRIEHFSPASSFPRKPLLATAGRMATVDASLRQPLRDYEGNWIIKYTNGAERRYAIDRSGIIVHAERRSSLAVKRGEVLLDFKDGVLERLEVHGNSLQVEHYNPARKYPWNFIFGTGVKQRR